MLPPPTGTIATSGRIAGSTALRYPSPFLDIASTYYPRTVRELIDLCQTYFFINPLLAATINKLARYPVTDAVVVHENKALRNRWSTFIREDLRFRSFQIAANVEYLALGNCFVSLVFPFVRQLECTECGERVNARTNQDMWDFRGEDFVLSCPSCKHRGKARVTDVPIKSASQIKLHRWPALDIVIEDGDYPGTVRYLYRVPPRMANQIRLGRKNVVSVLPLEFLAAVRQNRMVVLNPGNFFHLKRPALAGKHKGWGLPLIASVLKYVFFVQIMMKSMEVILVEHMVPLRILFPQAASTTSDPFANVWLADWRRMVETEIKRWKRDCITPGTLVETSKGLRPAGELQAGDMVRDHKGKWARVLRLRKRRLEHTERAYKLRLRGLPIVNSVFSEDHPIWAARSFNNGHGHKLGKPEFILVKDLKKRDYVGYPIPVLEGPKQKKLDIAPYTRHAVTDSWVYHDHKDPTIPRLFEYMRRHGLPHGRARFMAEHGCTLNQIKVAERAIRQRRMLRRTPRFIPIDGDFGRAVGLYLAEGSTSRRQVAFGLHRKEIHITHFLRGFFRKRFNASSFVVKRSVNGVQMMVNHAIAAELFRGLCPGTARSKCIPGIIDSVSATARREVLRGLLEGDGCCHLGSGSPKITYTSASFQLAEDVRRLLLSFGVAAGITFIPPSKKPSSIAGQPILGHGAYRVQVSGDRNLLRSVLQKPKFKDTRRRREYLSMGVLRDGYFWYRISDIEELSDKQVPEVISIHVSGENTFCTWGMATHNSGYIPIVPLPIGAQTIGGEGRSLLLSQEIRMWLEQVVSALEVPLSFMFGSGSYAGDMVALRQLENLVLSNVEDQRDLLKWVIKSVSAYMGWESPDSVHFKPFKTADYLQRQQFLFALTNAGMVSKHTLLSDNDLDYDHELELLNSELDAESQLMKSRARMSADAQAEGAVVMANAQVRAQAAAAQKQKALMQGPMSGTTPPGGIGGAQYTEQPPELPDVLPSSDISPRGPVLSPDGTRLAGNVNVSVFALADQLASRLREFGIQERAPYLDQIRAQNPELHALVAERMSPEMGGPQLPEQRAPRSQQFGL